MKRPAALGLPKLGVGLLFFCLATGRVAFGQESCPLSFAAYPSNELTSAVTEYPYYNFSLGVQQPLESTFLVDVTSNLSGANPAIPYGLYPCWCVDGQTAISPIPEQAVVPANTVYSGVLYSTCDANLNNELPPGHPYTLVSSAVWQMVNYLLNHQMYDGTNAFYWSVQAAINTLVGTGAGNPANCSGDTPVPDGCGTYSSYDPVVVEGLLTDATNNAATWVPVSGDVIGAVYVTATNNQFLLVEVPYTTQPQTGPYADVGITMTGVPNPVGVNNQLTYTLTVTNFGPTNAPDVVLTDSLPSSVIFTSASVSQGTSTNVPNGVNWNIGPLDVYASATATIIVLPTAAGTITNTATITLVPGTNLITDPNLANNTVSVSTLVTNASNQLGPYADVGITMTGVPNPVGVNNQLTYTLTVTNFGPTNAPDVVLTDSLPSSVIFTSASVSQGTPATVPNGVDWNIGALNVHASATATIIVLPTTAGIITNTATITLVPGTSLITDPNLANNIASVSTLVTNVSIEFDTPVLNPQTGLWDQTVQFNNLTGSAVNAVRIAVLDLAPNVLVYNATGETNGAPYVEYDQTVPNGSNVVFLIEYYDHDRKLPVATNFAAMFVSAVTVPAPTNEIGSPFQLDRPQFSSQGLFTIEFTNSPGHTYVVQYSSNMVTWLTATPPIMATNNRTQWVDAGPPVTQSPPSSNSARFYRIVEIH